MTTAAAGPGNVPAPPPSRWRGLGSNYWKLWGASTASNLGDGIAVIAFPWLATVLTSDALLIALTAVATRLPWLLFSLPAGVLLDRADRRQVMLWANALRAVAVGGVALSVVTGVVSLPLLYAAALLLGMSEVLFDNGSQVILPSVVSKDRLEAANGNLIAGQIVTNDFLGRPAGGLLVAVALALPFAVDAFTAVLSVALIASMRGTFRVPMTGGGPPPRVREQLADGLRWLGRHRVLRSLCGAVAVWNLAFAGVLAVMVLFVQDALGMGAAAFGVLMTMMGVGGIVGSQAASAVTRRLRAGGTLMLALAGFAVLLTIAGLSSNALVVGAAFVCAGFFTVVWNVVSVSLRQRMVPDELLGRVNSTFRFLGWGALPLGALLGGLLVSGLEIVTTRQAAVRAPFLAAAAVYALLWVFAAARLRSDAIEQAERSSDHE